MTLQYARLFQLRAGILLIAENGYMRREELAEALRQRKSIDAPDEEKVQGADDIITHLQEAHLITGEPNGYRLTTQEDLDRTIDNSALLYPGDAVPGAGEERTQADRILTNIMYEHPMLVILAKYIYRHGPVKDYEVKREFDGEEFLGDKMNSFTIDMGLNLLDDAGVIEEGSGGFMKGRWPVRLFAHVLHEEYSDLGGDHGGGVREPTLFERLETLYGINRSTFDTLLSRLHAEGVVSEASYEELILNPTVLRGANIHE